MTIATASRTGDVVHHAHIGLTLRNQSNNSIGIEPSSHLPKTHLIRIATESVQTVLIAAAKQLSAGSDRSAVQARHGGPVVLVEHLLLQLRCVPALRIVRFVLPQQLIEYFAVVLETQQRLRGIVLRQRAAAAHGLQKLGLAQRSTGIGSGTGTQGQAGEHAYEHVQRIHSLFFFIYFPLAAGSTLLRSVLRCVLRWQLKTVHSFYTRPNANDTYTNHTLRLSGMTG